MWLSTPSPGQWIFIILCLRCAYSENICKNQKCSCTFDTENNISKLHCTNTAVGTLERYLNSLENRATWLDDLKIESAKISLVNNSTFFALEAPRLAKLVLSFNGIRNISKDAFSKFEQVSSLDLSHNDITSIDGFRKMPHLRSLNLGFNKLENINNSDMFNGLESLEQLYLNDNLLTYIKEATFHPLSRLQNLSLNNNQLEDLSRGLFKGLTSLKYLDLQHNLLKSIELDSFGDLKGVVAMDMSENQLDTLQSQVFAGLQSLENLSLARSNIRNIRPGAFDSLINLKELDLTSNHITDLQERGFSGLSSLERLYITGNKIGALGESPFYDLRKIGNLTLTTDDSKAENTIVMGANFIELESNSLQGLAAVTTINFVNLKISFVREGVFRGLNELECVRFKNTTIERVSTKAFDGFSHKAHILGDSSEIGLYKNGGLYDFSQLQILSIASDAFRDLYFSDNRSSHLNLVNNNLAVLPKYAFRGVRNLMLLRLDHNGIEEIEPSTFDAMSFADDGYYNWDVTGCPFTCHNTLTLSNNNITSLKNNSFTGIKDIVELRLDGNGITSIEPGTFDGLQFHSKAHIAHHDLATAIPYNVLYLNNNNLTSVLYGTFSNIFQLACLRLDHNNINKVEPGAFTGLVMLESVTMYHAHTHINTNAFSMIFLNKNNLTLLPKHMFVGSKNVAVLRLDENRINRIEMEALDGLSTLKALNLSHNDLDHMTAGIFSNLRQLVALDLSCNRIGYLDEDLFSGLVKLQHLLLNDNKIKEIPFGIFNGLPLLDHLQLSNNSLSIFKTTIFPNQRRMRYLNLSRNYFNAINESVLFPLTNLEMLDVSNNRLAHINYGSLLLHLPNLHLISIDNNHWPCHFLTQMLNVFRRKGVNYLSNATVQYASENIDGISCTETQDNNSSIVENIDASLINETNAKLDHLISLLTLQTKNISTILNNLQSHVGTLVQISLENQVAESTDITRNASLLITFLEELLNKTGNHFNHPPPSYDNGASPGMLTILVLILLVLVCICVLMIFKLYKKRLPKRQVEEDNQSEIELLNA